MLIISKEDRDEMQMRLDKMRGSLQRLEPMGESAIKASADITWGLAVCLGILAKAKPADEYLKKIAGVIFAHGECPLNRKEER